MATQVELSAEDKLQKAREWLVEEWPLFTVTVMRMPLKVDEKCSTGCTDGRQIGYNPKWIDKLTISGAIFFLAHEVAHVQLLHHLRKGSRIHYFWNVAGDYAINAYLREIGLKLPHGVLYKSEYDGPDADWIYDEVMKEEERKAEEKRKAEEEAENKSDEDGDGDGPGQDDEDGDGDGPGQDDEDGDGDGPGQDDEDGPDGEQDDEDDHENDHGPEPEDSPSGDGSGDGEETEEDPEDGAFEGDFGQVREPLNEDGEPLEGDELEKEIDDVLVDLQQGITFQKKAGKSAAGAERLVKAFTAPQITAREMLQRYCEDNSRNQYNWSRPSRRSCVLGIPSASIHNQCPDTIVVAFDTSCSVSEEDVMRHAGMLEEILHSYPGTRIVTMCCDTMVYEETIQDFRAGETVDLKFEGGGGTDFRPVFEYVETHDLRPTVMVFFTDLAGVYPEDEPEYPVVWGVDFGTDNMWSFRREHWVKQVPFGDVTSI
jgi:predicted metal-dependent peptidase